ncbi:hypothetical protein U91I_03503 [alpha proteobacterium U9-1i]|nr:hypothetical protein U91I_03503 [alpha proteobacterium U9-1i]
MLDTVNTLTFTPFSNFLSVTKRLLRTCRLHTQRSFVR